ncbi:MAG: hypothetical protein II949_02920 [Prevotella sp.]|nr:hypothetical protein [Prevotella sp.]
MKCLAAKSHRGLTTVASRFNGWCNGGAGKRAFRYATSNATPMCCGRVPKGTLTTADAFTPAIEMAGYPCLMPTVSAVKNFRNLNHFILAYQPC